MEDAALPLPSPENMHAYYHYPTYTESASHKKSHPVKAKNRAVSEHGFLQQAFSADAAKRAMATAFSSVSRLVNTAKNSTLATPMSDTNSVHCGPRNRSNTTTSGWKLPRPPLSMPTAFRGLRRPAAFRKASRVWKGGLVEYVAAHYELQGHDASTISSYYHIIADGDSTPAGSSPLPLVKTARTMGSTLFAQQLVKMIEEALEDLTDRNRHFMDADSFEHAVTECITAARMAGLCYEQEEAVNAVLACTLTVVYFDRWHSRMHVFTIGDPKCIVVRKGAIVFESTTTQLEVHVPCCVRVDAALDIDEYVLETFDVEQGDLCLTFSNGVVNNLYQGDVLLGLEALNPNADEPMTLEQIADLLMEQSRGPKGESDVTADCLDDEPESDGLAPPAPLSEERLHPDGMPESWLRAMSQLDTLSEDEDDLPPPSFPFATAAARAFRQRVLSLSLDDLVMGDDEDTGDMDDGTDASLNCQDAMYDLHDDAQSLMTLHEGRRIFDHHIELVCPNRKPQFSLQQLKRMALSQARKRDDITLFITRFA